MGRPLSSALPLVFASLLLTACGGGGGESSSAQSQRTSVLAQEPNAPQFTGNTSIDGFNWFNYRRNQLGLRPVARNDRIDIAAQGHSDYQRINNTITHDQDPQRPGFTGRDVGERLAAAQYRFTPGAGYAFGEVISATSDPSGFDAAEDLIAAIYHRFVIFEPMFKEAGSGSATVPGGLTYFTTNFAANGLNQGLGTGAIVTYPVANQQRVQTVFLSDNEAPDPVPDRNEVGYPISVHADITSTVTVESFTVNSRGGAVLPTRLLTEQADPEFTPSSVAAIVPLQPLSPATVYDVQFAGTVDGVPVNRSWSFTTQ